MRRMDVGPNATDWQGVLSQAAGHGKDIIYNRMWLTGEKHVFTTWSLKDSFCLPSVVACEQSLLSFRALNTLWFGLQVHKVSERMNEISFTQPKKTNRVPSLTLLWMDESPFFLPSLLESENLTWKMEWPPPSAIVLCFSLGYPAPFRDSDEKIKPNQKKKKPKTSRSSFRCSRSWQSGHQDPGGWLPGVALLGLDSGCLFLASFLLN